VRARDAIIYRTRLMRNYVSGFNVYRWAGCMLQDAAAMRRRNRLRSRLRAEPLV